MMSLESKVIETLREHQILHRVLPHREPALTIESAAKERGVAADHIVKSILLADRDRRYVIACVAGDARVDLKALRAHLGTEWRRLRFASAEEIVAVTGYVQGAVAPVGLPAHVPVIIDEVIVQRSRVSISSGNPMAGVELDPRDLVRVSGARLARIVEWR